MARVSNSEKGLEEIARDRLPGRGRGAGIVSSLFMGIWVFVAFARSVGVLTNDILLEFQTRGFDALIDAATSQRSDQDDPVEFFFTCLQSAFVAGQAHISNPEGGCPANTDSWGTDPDAWGWHRWTSEDQVKTFDEADDSVTLKTVAATSGWRPKGKNVGWLLGTTLYLLPTASLQVAKSVARGIDATIDFTPWSLGKTLYERGLLLRAERSRDRYTARENLGGGRPNVLIVASSNVMPAKATDPASCRLYECEDHEISEVIEGFEGLIA